MTASEVAAKLYVHAMDVYRLRGDIEKIRGDRAQAQARAVLESSVHCSLQKMLSFAKQARLSHARIQAAQRAFAENEVNISKLLAVVPELRGTLGTN